MIVFTLSHDQCSFPGCSQPLIRTPDAKRSDFAVQGELCHIISPKQHGPRPNTDLTAEDLNHPRNLIAMCRNHHREIDTDPQTYTVQTLKAMKHEHEQSVRNQVLRLTNDIPISIISALPTEIIDKRVEDDTRVLYEKSFYNEFDAATTGNQLYKELTSGAFSLASRTVKAMALATLARIFEMRNKHALAVDAIQYATTLDCTPLVSITKLLIAGNTSRTSTSLQELSARATPAARTAGFLLTANIDGYDAALDWYRGSGLCISDFDPEGQLIISTVMLRNRCWGRALETVMEIPSTSFERMPALHHVVAMTNLVTTTPIDYRRHLINHHPLNAHLYPLSDKQNALARRRNAVSHFLAAAEAAEKYQLHATRANEEWYAIWLQLLDPQTAERGRKRLRHKLNPLDSALPFIQLGIEFDVLDNFQDIQNELNRQYVLNRGENHYSIAASLSLLLKTNQPDKVAAYIENRFDDLVEFVDSSSLIKAQILALSSAGQAQLAADRLAEISPDSISEEDRAQFAILIDPPTTTAELQTLQARYESTDGQLAELQTLVAHLEETKNWPVLCRYGKALFDEAPTAPIATSLAYAYHYTNQPQKIIDLVLEEVSILSLCPRYRLLYCWALYSIGDFREVRNQLRNLPITIDDEDYRTLRTNLDISTGQWDSLHTYIRYVLSHARDTGTAELFFVAKLAATIASPRTMELIRAAAKNGPSDPEVLIACNLLGIGLGYEDDPDVSDWLLKAIALSQPDGPFKIISLDDIAAYHHDLMETELNIRNQLVAAEIPLYLAAHYLQRGLVDLTLIRAMYNSESDDIRKSLPIPTYCARRPTQTPNEVQDIGVDATALLTLTYLEVLDTVIESFDRVIISSSMIEWIFEEKARLIIRETGRLKQALDLLKLREADFIDRIVPQLNTLQPLINEVGVDLATLLAAAKDASMTGIARHFVVHPTRCQIHDSDDEAATIFEGYQSLITSCSSVIDWLKRSGKLLRKELADAYSFLRHNEEQQSHSESINEGSHLYLSSLAVMYLHRLNVLDRLMHSRVTVHVSDYSIKDARQIKLHREKLDITSGHIDTIRSILVSGIDSGKVHFASRKVFPDSEVDWLAQHPSADLMAVAERSHAVVCDDRFSNKYSDIEQLSQRIPILNTLDLIDILVQRRHLSHNERDHLRTKLRQAGFIFIPVTSEELVRFLQESEVVDGSVSEIAELRAIRENIRVIRAHRWFHTSIERWWMDSMFTAVAKAMTSLWHQDAHVQDAEVYCAWLRKEFNVRHYGHIFRGNDALVRMRSFETGFICKILFSAQDLPRPRLTRFLVWFDEAIVKPLRWIDRELYDTVVEKILTLVSGSVIPVMHQQSVQPSNGESTRTEEAVVALLSRIPSSVRDTLLDDSDFVERYKLIDRSIIRFDGFPLQVYRSSLICSIRRLFADLGTVPVRSRSGEQCFVRFAKRHPGVPELCQGRHSILLEEFVMFSPNIADRIRSFKQVADFFALPKVQCRQWRQILDHRTPSVHEFETIRTDLRDSPAHVARSAIEAVKHGQPSFELLAPASRRYYARLIGEYDSSETIDQFIQGSLGGLIDEHLESVDPLSISRCLSMAIHPSVVERIPFNADYGKELEGVFTQIVDVGDVLARVAAVELALHFAADQPSLGRFVRPLVDSIIDEKPYSTPDRFVTFVDLFVIIDARISQTQTLADCPPFYRRTAALVQAALIQDAIGRSKVGSQALPDVFKVPGSVCHRVQSLADMRLAPRWNPSFALPAFFMASASIRIQRAIYRAQMRLGQAHLQELIGADVFAKCSGDRWPSLEFPPSPVEASLNDLADPRGSAPFEANGLLGSVDPFDQLMIRLLSFKSDEVTLSDFESELDDFERLVAKDLDWHKVSSSMSLLATVAGTTRSTAVTCRVHSILLQFLRERKGDVDVGLACDIGIAACSSRSGFLEWRQSIASWFEDLAGLDLDILDRDKLSYIIEVLCFLIPELWIDCSALHAALDSGRC